MKEWEETWLKYKLFRKVRSVKWLNWIYMNKERCYIQILCPKPMKLQQVSPQGDPARSCKSWKENEAELSHTCDQNLYNLLESMAEAPSTKVFESRLDKYWKKQEVIHDFMAKIYYSPVASPAISSYVSSSQDLVVYAGLLVIVFSVGSLTPIFISNLDPATAVAEPPAWTSMDYSHSFVDSIDSLLSFLAYVLNEVL